MTDESVMAQFVKREIEQLNLDTLFSNDEDFVIIDVQERFVISYDIVYWPRQIRTTQIVVGSIEEAIQQRQSIEAKYAYVKRRWKPVNWKLKLETFSIKEIAWPE